MARKMACTKKPANRPRVSEPDETDADDGKLVDLTRCDAADDEAGATRRDLSTASFSTLHTAICPSSGVIRSSQLVESSSVPSQSTSRTPVRQSSRCHCPCLQARGLVNLNRQYS